MMNPTPDLSVKTPICDFVDNYANSSAIRLHMPGHKGFDFSGNERFDITEIQGADSLFTASGIIKESEEIAGSFFESNCFYSAEGSSLCIRAMLYLAKKYGFNSVIAGRNSHKSFVSAATLIDMPIEWLIPREDSLLSSDYDLNLLEQLLKNGKKCVYVTTPDYLGGLTDVKKIAEICKRHNSLLLVDNAHGAYLKFLEKSLHPIDLGADLCCDSAHKTLPVLTGGAYLHISRSADGFFAENARDAMSLFASTSPSYLILRSLDYANRLIPSFKSALESATKLINEQKARLASHGYELVGDELLKITVSTKPYGYLGTEISELFQQKGIYCEFCDRDFIVFMLSPFNSDFITLTDALIAIKRRAPIDELPPKIPKGEQKISPREALFAKTELISVSDAVGRVFASLTCACPPAVMLVTLGEVIGADAVKCLEYYGVESVRVVI